MKNYGEIFDKENKKLYYFNRIGMIEMKKSYLVQIIIDVVIILLGLFNYIFPEITGLNPNMTFYVMLSIYAGLELCEYIFDRTRMEPLYLFFASSVAAFSGLFLREYNPNYVLSITIAVWILVIVLIKIISLEEIFEKKTHLFQIKLTCMSVIVLVGLLVSINLYFRISTISFMLGFMYMTYGVLELSGDFLSYLSENSKFLKE